MITARFPIYICLFHFFFQTALWTKSPLLCYFLSGTASVSYYTNQQTNHYWLELREGMFIHEGMLLRTGENSMCFLLAFDKTKMEIGEKSVLRIDQGTDQYHRLLCIVDLIEGSVKGAIRSDIKNLAHAYYLKNCAVRFTMGNIYIFYEERTKKTIIGSEAGKAEIFPAEDGKWRFFELTSGKLVTITETPSGVRALTEKDITSYWPYSLRQRSIPQENISQDYSPW